MPRVAVALPINRFVLDTVLCSLDSFTSITEESNLLPSRLVIAMVLNLPAVPFEFIEASTFKSFEAEFYFI
jgi:hypothetical protein